MPFIRYGPSGRVSTVAPSPPPWTPFMIDSLKGLFIAGDVIDSLGKSSGDTTYLFPNRARWWNAYAFRNAYQLTDAQKPIIIDSSGQRYLMFDGSDDGIATDAVGQHTQPYTAIVVAFPWMDGGTTYRAIWSTTTTNAAIRSYLYARGILAARGVYHSGTNLSYNLPSDSIMVMRAIGNGAMSEVWVNGVLTGSGDAGMEGVDGLTFGSLYGGANSLKVRVYGMAFYHKVLTPTEAAAVELWLREECLK